MKDALELQSRIGWVATALVILVVAILLFFWRGVWPLIGKMIDRLEKSEKEATEQLRMVTREFLDNLAADRRNFEAFSRGVLERLDRIDGHLGRRIQP